MLVISSCPMDGLEVVQNLVPLNEVPAFAQRRTFEHPKSWLVRHRCDELSPRLSSGLFRGAQCRFPDKGSNQRLQTRDVDGQASSTAGQLSARRKSAEIP